MQDTDGNPLTIPPISAGLGTLDWSIVALYFAGILFLAWRVSGNQSSTRDYFLGGRSLPWWAAALSIVATETSAVTIIGVPRIAFEGNWSFLQLIGGFVLGRVFLAAFFVRAFYTRDFETVYEYLGDRFGRIVQRLASVMFLAGRVIASGVRLFAGCLAVQVACGLTSDALSTAVISLGVCGVVMTFFGGVRAVVWTDVVLGLTFIVAGIGCAVYLLNGIEGGLTQLPDLRAKLAIVDFGVDLKQSNTLLAGLLGGFVLTLATHGTDQDLAQRFLTCRDARQGSYSLLASACVLVPMMVLFLAIGTLLYYFYGTAQAAYPLPEDRNHLFPTFVVKELPTGFRGIVIAAILAASLSSLTSALNALASTTVADVYRPLRERLSRSRGDREQAHLLRASRGITLLWGGVVVVAALAFAASKGNILTLALKALTYFYGALLGVFLLGLFTRRGNPLSVVTGMLTGVGAVLLLQARQFIATPDGAPGIVRELIQALPETTRHAVLNVVPELAWNYWLVVGATLTLVIGSLGQTRPVAQDC